MGGFEHTPSLVASAICGSVNWPRASHTKNTRRLILHEAHTAYWTISFPFLPRLGGPGRSSWHVSTPRVRIESLEVLHQPGAYGV
jgi:hypothetical protein